jgi:hypothetical protein
MNNPNLNPVFSLRERLNAALFRKQKHFPFPFPIDKSNFKVSFVIGETLLAAGKIIAICFEVRRPNIKLNFAPVIALLFKGVLKLI